MEKEFKNIILYEIRENRKAITNLQKNSIIMTTKFKLITIVTSSIFGVIGSIIVLYFKKNL